MARYRFAILIGACAFTLQIWSNVTPHIAALNPHIKAASLASLRNGLTSATTATILGYLLLGLVAHLVPTLLATRILSDLRTHANASLKRYLSPALNDVAFPATALVLIILANRAAFPGSRAFLYSDLIFAQTASVFLIYGIPAVATAAFAYWLIRCTTRGVQWFLAITALFAALWIQLILPPSTPASVDQRATPDLILIGIDSLRPDHLRAFGYPGKSPAPFIDNFVSNSVYASRAYTPLARTFVAYTSILTGQYPTRHQARENLYPSGKFNHSQSITHVLAEQGYETLFAMDESRFANFDRNFGFDKVVTPPPGVVDFIVGEIFDTPATNLIQLIPGSELLLPHVAGNRGASSIYRPRIHDRKIRRALSSLDPNRPWFVVAHFTMPHWPYAPVNQASAAPKFPMSDSPESYRAALEVADNQVRHLLEDLRIRGRLGNAVVVLLSDHGEALAMAKDRWTITGTNGDTSGKSYYGHGRPALDPAQAAVVLTFQRFLDGRPLWPRKNIPEVVSLVDVIPTASHILGTSLDGQRFDGVPIIDPQGNPIAPEHRPVFIESGLSGTSLQAENLDQAAVATEFGHLYRVTPEFRIELSPDEIPGQLRTKQRAVVVGNWGLSSNPGRDGKPGCWLKLDMNRRIGKCLLLGANDPVVTSLRPRLCQHFALDREFHRQWCAPLVRASMPKE